MEKFLLNVRQFQSLRLGYFYFPINIDTNNFSDFIILKSGVLINCPTQKNQYFELHPKAAAIQPKLLTFQDRAELRKAVALQRQGASLWPRQAG